MRPEYTILLKTIKQIQDDPQGKSWAEQRNAILAQAEAEGMDSALQEFLSWFDAGARN